MSLLQIEVHASLARSRLNLDREPCVTAEQILEALRRGLAVRTRVLQDKDLYPAVAQVDAANGRLAIARSLQFDIERNTPRAKLILAEELAHLEHAEGTLIASRSAHRHFEELLSTEMRNEELRAKNWARAFVAPYRHIHISDLPASIMHKFNISMEVAQIRYTTCHTLRPQVNAAPEIERWLLEDNQSNIVKR
jgi:hypothetical protein